MSEFLLNNERLAAQAPIDVAAIQMQNGLFELICLDVPLPGMRSDRISTINRVQLDKAMAGLLPDISPEERYRLVLGGVVAVSSSAWLELKRELDY